MYLLAPNMNEKQTFASIALPNEDDPVTPGMRKFKGTEIIPVKPEKPTTYGN